jgi:hypothetical protein
VIYTVVIYTVVIYTVVIYTVVIYNCAFVGYNENLKRYTVHVLK